MRMLRQAAVQLLQNLAGVALEFEVHVDVFIKLGGINVDLDDRAVLCKRFCEMCIRDSSITGMKDELRRPMMLIVSARKK